MDFVGPLPKSKYNGKTYDTIFTVVDRFNGWVFALPTIQEATAEYTATLFFDAVVSFKGLPISIISDRDIRFKSNFWTALMNKLHVSLDMSSTFHPQTDRSSERANKTIIQTLRILPPLGKITGPLTWHKSLTPLILLSMNPLDFRLSTSPMATIQTFSQILVSSHQYQQLTNSWTTC